MTRIYPQVRRGAELLDATIKDWRQAIDVASLNLGDSSSCVLGQLNRAGYLGEPGFLPDDIEDTRYWEESPYLNARDALFLDEPKDRDRQARATEHGFDTGMLGYETLTEQWKAVIEEGSW